MPISSSSLRESRLDKMGAVVVSSTRMQDLPLLFLGRPLMD